MTRIQTLANALKHKFDEYRLAILYNEFMKYISDRFAVFQVYGADTIIKVFFTIYYYKKNGTFEGSEEFIKDLYFFQLYFNTGEEVKDWCPRCAGDGEYECGDCDGTGEVEDEDEEYVECGECGGTGKVECDECDGTGDYNSGEYNIEYINCISWDKALKSRLSFGQDLERVVMDEDDFDDLKKSKMLILCVDYESEETDKPIGEYFCTELSDKINVSFNGRNGIC